MNTTKERMDPEVLEVVARLVELIEATEEDSSKVKTQRNLYLSMYTNLQLEALRAVHGTLAEAATMAINNWYQKTITEMLGDKTATADEIKAGLMDATYIPMRVRFQHEPSQRLSDVPFWTVVRTGAEKLDKLVDVLRVELGIYPVTKGADYASYETLSVLKAIK